ncbi:GNAT family N-acetyltransferase [Muriicola soli]|uniref:GNAT family N-acetyltransferase n=1 Tax=Muriicola soli TaxID=2507538 RepID=A0A411E7I0_9FLAO|nr:GNAT family N-acetyltransferase [Muriicola soli]QBA63484.1 GNAT family N-acetyltransferase [Muriicola soli]
MKEILIRDAVLNDLPALLQFEEELIAAERPFDPTIREGEVHYYDLRSYIENREIKVVVAEVKGKVVSSGFGLSKPGRHYLDHKNYAYLGFMYTLPEFRGRGINRMIIDELKAWAYENKLSEIRLTVYDDNSPALNAYFKAGFKKHIVEMRLPSP